MHLPPHGLLYEGNAGESQLILGRGIFGARGFSTGIPGDIQDLLARKVFSPRLDFSYLTLLAKLNDSAELYLEPPLGTEALPSRYVPNPSTAQRVFGWCDTGTVTFNVERRAKATPNTTGTNVCSSSVTATSSSVESTSFNSGGSIAPTAGEHLVFVLSAVASSPTKFLGIIEWKVN